jgi:cytochrome b
LSGQSPGAEPVVESVRLWDPLLRLFHWALTGAVVTAWVLGKWGPAIMTWHFWVGYAVLGLLAFRLIWGLVGPRPARFASFAYGPGAILRYVGGVFARRPSYWPGHNPLGGAFVFLILIVLVAQAVTGLMADADDFINAGPIAADVGRETAITAAAWHKRLANLTLALVVIHVGAILFYRIWKREDLVRPMITGRKQVRREEG